MLESESCIHYLSRPHPFFLTSSAVSHRVFAISYFSTLAGECRSDDDMIRDEFPSLSSSDKGATNHRPRVLHSSHPATPIAEHNMQSHLKATWQQQSSHPSILLISNLQRIYMICLWSCKWKFPVFYNTTFCFQDNIVIYIERKFPQYQIKKLVKAEICL